LFNDYGTVSNDTQHLNIRCLIELFFLSVGVSSLAQEGGVGTAALLLVPCRVLILR